MVGLAEFPDLVTESEAAERMRCSIDTVRRERKRGRIGFTRVGARIFYTEDQLSEYLSSQRVEPCQERKSSKGKSGIIGYRNDQTATRGVEHGSTQVPDRHAAHHLAQQTFGKPS